MDYTLVIFGITSNLAQKYLIPTLYDMQEKGILPKGMKVIGIARTPMPDLELKKYIHSVLHMDNLHHKHEIKEKVFSELVQRFKYVSGDITDRNLYSKLNLILRTNNKIYYLATYPELYSEIFDSLKKSKLNKQTDGWTRIMVEKPFGHNLSSANLLNKLLLKYFREDQIFRLDHYLGKETLQNILTFRFGNDIFEPLINKDYIDHIQISVLEDYGIGKRGGYYELVGALKDVGQNHLLQMLAFATMDAPQEFTNEAVTNERVKILKNLKPLLKDIVFGQYEGYRSESAVSPNSQTETFFALKTFINNNRFDQVPIYLRAGKKLKTSVTEVSIVFKNPVNRLFKNTASGDEPNVLIYRIQPNEGIVVKILTKIPGHQIRLQPEYMQYCYKVDPHAHYFPDPYERLLIDTIRGDQTFFNDADEVEAQWTFIDPLASIRGKPHIYKPGSWGPKEADELIEKDGRAWLEPSMAFCRI